MGADRATRQQRTGPPGARVTIHTEHPFLDPSDDPVRRLRGRLGGGVTLWTSGGGSGEGGGGGDSGRAGLTVSSVMVSGGEPGRVLALLDPDSALCEQLETTGRAVVALLQWQHRDLAEAFAGRFPAPGGAFKMGEWEQTSHGPRLTSAPSWVAVDVESRQTVGWSELVVARIDGVVLAEDDVPLEHRRGRYVRPAEQAPPDR